MQLWKNVTNFNIITLTSKPLNNLDVIWIVLSFRSETAIIVCEIRAVSFLEQKCM